MKQIILVTKTEDLIEVIKNLQLTEEFKKNTTLTISLDIEDTKKNFEYLIKSDKIINWDFAEKTENNNSIEEKETTLKEKNNVEKIIDEVKKELKKNSSEENMRIEEDKKKLDYVKNIIQPSLSSSSDFAKLIFYCWKHLVEESDNLPEFSFTINTKVIPDLYKSKQATIHPYDIYLEQYYNQCEFNDILNDVIDKLYKNWDKIGKINSMEDLFKLFNIIKINDKDNN